METKASEVKIEHSLMIVDDDPGIREFLKETFNNEYEVITTSSAEEALSTLENISVDVVLLDIKMPGIGGIGFLQNLDKIQEKPAVIVITADREIDTAVNAMKLGAYDYLVKPFDLSKLKITVNNAIERINLEKELRRLREQVEERFAFENIVGKSKKMQEVFKMMKKVLNNDATVLIIGESGTGKELVARAIHYNSPRKDKPFVAIDCAAIPDSLMENEFFGHEKGAFTGAVTSQKGKLELADGGTLFLDEIGNLRLDLQAKLLRVLQEREFTRIGGTKRIKVNIRVIAATNIDLAEAVKQGKFREDLYYRINVFPIHLPPLRERIDDIPLLATHFLKIYNDQYHKNVKISADAIEKMMQYDWPGNVRELENLISRLVLIKEDGEEITTSDLPSEMTSPKTPVLPQGITLKELEKNYIQDTLKTVKGNISEAARILGLSRKTLYNKIKEFNLEQWLEDLKRQ